MTLIPVIARRSAGAAVVFAALLSAVTARVILAQVPQMVLDRDAKIAQLAIEAAQRGPVAPIPLLGEGGRAYGALYDQYLIGVVLARARMAAGESVDTESLMQHPTWQSRGTVVAAYPVNCDGAPNHPRAIRWKTSLPMPVQPTAIGEPLRGSAAQALLPGVAFPNDALVVNLRNAPPIGASVDVDYAGPICRGGATTASLPVDVSPSRELATAFNGVKLPDEFAALPSPTTVRVSVILDSSGRLRFPDQVQGPPELGPVAIAALDERTFPPARMNGVIVPFSTMATFVFTATGTPAQAAPYTPAAPPGALVMTTTTRVPAARPPLPPGSVPPPPPGQAEAQFTRLAIELAAARDPLPIPLDAAGPPVHGVLFDRFLVAAVKARAAFKAGTPIDPAAVPASFLREDLIAVAFPLACDGRTIAPAEIHVAAGAGTRPGPLAAASPMLSDAALQARLPGVPLPAGAAGRAFVNAAPSTNLEARITYAEPPCGAAGATLTLPIQWTRGAPLPHVPFAKLPEGSTLPSPTVVRVRGLVDLDGAYRFPTLAEGPPELAATAMVAAASWRFQPYRANGVSSLQGVIMTLTFTASGKPEAMPPGGARPSPQPPPGAPPSVMTSSSRGGRSTTDFTTPDVPDLSAPASRCEIAADATYGFAPANPIKIGGGPRDGPARERQYLSFLRGPAGQGLRVVRIGSAMGPDQTILDLYEITYAGLTTPLRLYLDEYHDDAARKAPSGLVCAAPIVLR